MRNAALILALVFACAVLRAQTCANYNFAQTPQYDDASDMTDHISGDHLFAGTATGQCSYSSTGNPNCQSLNQTKMSPEITDSGLLIAIQQVGYHVGHMSTTNGSQVNPSGESSATAIGTAAWEFCLSSSCSFTVTSNPISTPPSAIWTHTQNAGFTCPAKADPTYGSGGGGCGVARDVTNGGCGGNCPITPGGCPAGQTWDSELCACEQSLSPIIVDTTGKGFRLTSAESGVTFDIRGNGHPIQLSWTASDSGNAFLALDLNHNGKIDGGKELFGNFTDPDCDNGYCALAKYDSNGDGVIDWRDPIYSKLVLWIDANHDGVSQPEELHTLPELGVFSIGLKYRHEPLYDLFRNSFRYRGVLNPDLIDGTSRDGRYTYDVFFVGLLDEKARVNKEARQVARRLNNTLE
jgi:hypothetical protein